MYIFFYHPSNLLGEVLIEPYKKVFQIKTDFNKESYRGAAAAAAHNSKNEGKRSETLAGIWIWNELCLLFYVSSASRSPQALWRTMA